MPSKSSLETRPSERPPEIPAGRQAGSALMVAVFASFLFSVLGLGLFMMTGTYRRWSSYKNDAVLLRTAAENGVRAGYGALEGLLAGRTFPLPLTDAEYDALRTATLGGQTDAVGAVLGVVFPMIVRETAGWSEWTAETGFRPVSVADSESFFAAEFAGTVDARGKLARRPQTRRTVLDLGLTLAAGRVPLAAFPFLLAGENATEQAAKLLAEEKLVFAPPESGGRIPPPAATNLALVPADPSPQLAEALRIKIFSPDKLSVLQIRQALGLPLVDEPVPDGVYLVAGESVLGGLFVQGDVEEMILAADSGRQHLQLRLEAGLWRLWFDPAEKHTEFTGPEESRIYELVPIPIIMVNGDVASLGGGIVEPDGTLALTEDPEAPSVLAGVPLTIVSAGETVVSTHLTQEGVRWKDGIPYLKDSTAQLFLYASGADFVTGSRKDGRIRISADAPADLFFQGSLTARDGVRFDGEGRSVTVSGGLQASDLETGGGLLTVRPDDRLTSPFAPGGGSPRAASPVLFVSGWETLQWSDR